MCVDPNDQVLSVRKFMLETRGYAVKTAQSDEQGIDILHRGGIDLVLSCSPGVIREVKVMGLLLPSIFLTGYAEPVGVNADATLGQGQSVAS